MKFPESWLREWADPAVDTTGLAERLTLAGHEVDAIENEGEGLAGTVIAQVLEVAAHPDADRLSVCRVTDGQSEVEVVCGAPNVSRGMKAVLALPGTTLPDGLKLRRSKIRGVVSNGMLCSQAELRLGDDSDGIVRLPDDAPTGTSLANYLGLPDHVLQLNLTPNRGDCFSVSGLARDIAAITGCEYLEQAWSPVAPVIKDVHPVVVDDPAACPRFAGRVVRNISRDVSTPLWMTERLRRCGIRAIHPVVDVTNYVMLETGQPLHAYDLDLLRGAIRPRFAVAGEKTTLLDEKEITLQADTVVISDDSGVIGLAGIMGGLETAVTDATCNVFLEAAFWPPSLVAGRARTYGLHTDASLRFERGVDPSGQAAAVERATRLLVDIAGGEPGPLSDVCHDRHRAENAWIHLRQSRLARVLGTDIPESEIRSILTSLGLTVETVDGGWRARTPSFRFDLQIEEDLIEEVARIHGYDRIPEQTPTAPLPLRAATERRVELDRVVATLVARDYFEVITYSFVDGETNRRCTGEQTEIVLSNPISSDMAVMRGSLWPGLLKIAAANLARQQQRVRLFEIGKTFHGALRQPLETVRVAGLVAGPAVAEQWGSKHREVDFFDIKSDITALLALTGSADEFHFEACTHPALQPGQSARILRQEVPVGVAGKLHPELRHWLDLAADCFVFELEAQHALAAEIPAAAGVSRFPSVRRDIAVIVKENVTAAELIKVVLAAAPDIIRRAVVFDVYHGPGIEAGLKSIALGLILQETSRTLTDEDAESALSAVVRSLQKEFAAILRD